MHHSRSCSPYRADGASAATEKLEAVVVVEAMHTHEMFGCQVLRSKAQALASVENLWLTEAYHATSSFKKHLKTGSEE